MILVVNIINTFSFFLTWFILFYITGKDYNYDIINDYILGIYNIIFFIGYFIVIFNYYFPIILFPFFISLIFIIISMIPYTDYDRKIFLNFKLIRFIRKIFSKQKKLGKVEIKEMKQESHS